MNTSILLSVQGNEDDVVTMCKLFMKITQDTSVEITSLNVNNPVHRAGLEKILTNGPKAYKLLKV